MKEEINVVGIIAEGEVTGYISLSEVESIILECA